MSSFENFQSFDIAPLYSLIHEPIYAQMHGNTFKSKGRWLTSSQVLDTMVCRPNLG